MLGVTLKRSKVVWIIVLRVPVDVIHNLSPQQKPSELGFEDDTREGYREMVALGTAVTAGTRRTAR